MDPLLSLRSIAKRFGRTRVLDDVTADVHRGRITALVGPNGSGKSTLNKILLGFVSPDHGTAMFDGHDLLRSADARATIGYMPQQPRLPEQLTARDLLELLHRLRPDAARDERALDLLQVGPLFDTRLGVLSGGQRQRINAALALHFRPVLAVLDEPTAGLDPDSAQQLKLLLRDLTREGRSVLVTSHVLSELETLADDVLFLLEGRVAFAGPLAALRARATDGSLEGAIAAVMHGEASEVAA
ncbi:MAG: ABC transporter ATP-binding protein [Gemmatimonadaceae bacterium]|jgi:Cu-processing system ATP-binding protein|nr:ABC transporter ATP-binding protein [Gemmatimonadaceae bacterium]